MSESGSPNRATRTEGPSAGPRDRRRQGDLAPAIFVLVLGIVAIWLAADVSDEFATDELGGSFLPRILGGLLIVLSLGLFVAEIRRRWKGNGRTATSQGSATDRDGFTHGRDSEADFPLSPGGQTRADPLGARRVMTFVALMALYTVFLGIIGYLAASFLSFSAMIFVAGERRVPRAGLGGAIITGCLYVLFAVILDINVPRGIIFP